MPDSQRSPAGSAPGLRLSACLYRLFIRTLPSGLRRSHGEAMVQTFRDMYRAEYRRGGVPALAALWRRAVTQTIAAGAAERLEAVARRRSSRPDHENYRATAATLADHIGQDLRFAARSFRSRPAFTVTAVTIIALGIGATSTIFSVVDGVVLRKLPYPDPDRLVYFDEGSHTVPDYREWTARASAFDALAAVWPAQMDLLGEGPPTRIATGRVTPEFFPIFGGVPVAGRLLTESDATGPAPVAVLSHAFWLHRFGGDETVIGRTIDLDGSDYEVVGIADPGFSPPRRVTRRTTAVWVPLDVTRAELQLRSRYVLSVVGRLRSGVKIETAGAEVDATLHIMAQEYPEEYVRPNGSIRQVPLVPLLDAEVGRVKNPLMMLLGAVGLLMLIACANVANLLLARGTDREREVAVRSALGASQRRITVQFLTESMLLSLVGGAIGVALALLGVDAFTSLGPSRIPRLDQIAVDYRVLAFSVAASVATGVVFGIAPAFYAANTDVNGALKDATSNTSASRGRLRLKGTLVVAEIALALVLLVGAGLLFNSFIRLTRVDPGFVADRVVAVPLAPEHGYESEEARLQFAHATLARVRSIPGVRSASIGVTAPFAENGRCCWMTQAKGVAGDDSVRVVIHPVAPRYFSSLGVRLIRGRDFTSFDGDADPPPVVITDALAQRMFQEAGAVGRTLTLGRNNPTPFTVIGVVDDLKFWSLSRDEDVDVFVPFETFGAEFSFFTVVVRTAGEIEGFPNQIREAIWSVDDRLPVPEIFSLTQRVRESITEPRFLSALLLTFAGFAILLAAGGIYGTMLYAVSRRSHELGIRLALGASTAQLQRYVLRGGAALTASGLAIGLAGAYALSRALTTLVFGITAHDAPTYAATTVLLAAVAMLACYLPARKAARLDPMATLRTE